MNRTIEKYRKRQDSTDRWPLVHAGLSGVRQVVVIPVLAEHPRFLDTLSDLAQSGKEAREATLILLVVNNRAQGVADLDDCANNLEALNALEQGAHPNGLRIAWVDAAREGSELPPKEGVGLARKIGLDWALEVLVRHHDGRGALICLDADTRVDADYLDHIDDYFQSGSRWAAVLEYAHPLDGDAEETRAILCYEIFLRYFALSLAWAGSPFACHTIGSAMACTVEAYAACGGMRRRQAGEDFYFLQALGKTGRVDCLNDVIVRPASRPSHRVPFGTGKRVQRFLDGEHDEYRLYHPESYGVLRDWFALANSEASAEELMEKAGVIRAELGTFLEAEDFPTAWDRVVGQHRDAAARQRQFHLWCDGLRTLRLLHHLRDTVLPDIDMFEAVGALFARCGKTPPMGCEASLRDNVDGQITLLEALRTLQRQTLTGGGL